MTTQVHKGYVKTSDGKWLVQIPDPHSQFGFCLFSNDQSWDGGIGISVCWKAVDTKYVPSEIKDKLGYILDEQF